MNSIPNPLLHKLLRPCYAALAVCLLTLPIVGVAQAPSAPPGAGIYTCIDTNGKRLTSDRPITACIDREQRVLSGSGTTKHVIGPTLSIAEREAREAREREAALVRQRAQESVRQNRVLLARYPDKATHDISREHALSSTQSVIDAATARIAELAQERKSLDDEMEFYRKDPSRAPANLRRRIESNTESLQQQQQAIADQRAERTRINARYDAELERLQQLWLAK